MVTNEDLDEGDFCIQDIVDMRDELLEENARYKIALEDVRRHQTVTAGSMCTFSPTWHIANNVLTDT